MDALRKVIVHIDFIKNEEVIVRLFGILSRDMPRGTTFSDPNQALKNIGSIRQY